jgi:ankyrin repeat protein
VGVFAFVLICSFNFNLLYVRFRKIFTETVDWTALSAESLMHDGALTTDAMTPQNKRRRNREQRMSWKYSLDRATAYNSRDIRLLRHLVAEGCSVTEMFNISIAHAQDNRYSEELEALYQTACIGYLPAQALYVSLADKLPVGEGHVPLHSISELNDWSLRAASSGYLFADIAGLEPALVSEARKRFKDSGGYNAHYCGTGDEDQYSTGLVGKIATDLHHAPLHLAAAFDDLVTPDGVSSSLFESDIDINSLDHWQDTAVMKCCMAGHIASLRALITRGADASITNPSSGLSPLHWLFMFHADDMTEAISLLIEGGGDPRYPSIALAVKAFHFPFGWPSGTPLHWAVFARNEAAVRALLDHGANIFDVDAAGQDSLGIAMKMLNVELVSVLLDYGKRSHHDDPLRSFIVSGGDEHHTSPTFVSSYDADKHRSPLHDFMWDPLAVGVDPEFEDYCSEEVALPLNHYIAVLSGTPGTDQYIEVLRAFQQRYPTCLRWRSGEGFTPLDVALAFAEPKPEVVEYMIKGGSPVDARTIYGTLMGHFKGAESDLKATYLDIILRTLTPETARELANWPLEEPYINRSLVPLQYATIRGFLRSAQVLLKYGADPRATRENGHSPLDHARDLVTGNVTERMTKIPDTPKWPGISYGMFTCPTDMVRRLTSQAVSRETYSKEQIRMQEAANTERREILRLLESHPSADTSVGS